MKKIIFVTLVLFFFTGPSVLGSWIETETRRCYGGDCPCVNTSWSPAPSTVCLGTSFTQTGNCGDTRTATGTKTCTGNSCSTPSYICSDVDVWTKYSDWLTNTCSSGSCSYQVSIYGGCNSSQNCGTATCKNSYDYEYCNGSEIRGKTMGYEEICRSNSLGCGESLRQCNDYHVEDCEVGYTCKVTGLDVHGYDDAECVPKSSGWTED